ncbi:hypothetical protein AV654_19380 [Paenibacillus elgii]|uniref:Uncharacterized protein n=1 Tax=Paenibacillus elgii TaxID=189691 RepID=A0A161S1T2_9BACL|nr:S16 family serine protease [Paenibacillus elgii]KZE78139.1 hypothetical protein AV654_19380 [Paenibacillus elgii]
MKILLAFLVLSSCGFVIIYFLLPDWRKNRNRPRKQFLMVPILALASLFALCGIIGLLLKLPFFKVNMGVDLDGSIASVDRFVQQPANSPFQFVAIQSESVHSMGDMFYYKMLYGWKHPRFWDSEDTVIDLRTDAENSLVGQNDMKETIDAAYLAAYRYLEKPLENTTTYEILTTYSKFPESQKFRAGDQIVSYNGQAMQGVKKLDAYLRESKDKTVNIGILREGKPQEVALQRNPYYTGIYSLGFHIGVKERYSIPEQSPKLVAPDKVQGQSAGLVIALELVHQLGNKPYKEIKVAATGAIDAEGKVHEVGGLYNKVATVSKQKVDLFLVPKSQELYALKSQKELGVSNLRIKGVSSLEEAFQALE